MYTRATLAPSKPITLVAATEDRGDDGLILLMAGAELDRYRTNPVVLWQHQRDRPPVGRADRLHIQGGRLLADIAFDTADELGATLDRQYRAGTMRSLSISFTILDRRGDVVTSWRLLEISAVTLGADPGAVADLPAAGRQHRVADLRDIQLAYVRALAAEAVHGYRRATGRR